MKVQGSALWAKALGTCVFATLVSLFYISFAVASYPFSDDMESGQGTWTFDEPWAIGEDDSYSPTHSLMDSPGSSYANDIDISVSNVFDLTASYRPLLTFWHRYNLEKYGDFGYVEVKPVGGDWQKLFFVTGFSGVNWEKVEIDLSEYANTEITLRFRLVTNASVTYDGWYIDDVSISDNTGTASYPFFDDGESGPDNWITSTCGLTNHDYHSPTHSWNEAPDGGSVSGVSSRLSQRGTLDFSGAVNPQLSFWYHRNQGYWEGLYVDVSANDGLTWTTVWSQAARYAPTTWSRTQIDLSDYTGLDAVTLRFRMDGASFSDIWYLDDILIADACENVILNPPENITEHSMDISWTQATCTTDFDCYEVYRSTDPDVDRWNGELIAEIYEISQTSLSDTDIPLADTTYYYRVYVIDTEESYEGLYNQGSNPVQGTTSFCDPPCDVPYDPPFDDDMEAGDTWANDLPWALVELPPEKCHSGTHCWHDSPDGVSENNLDRSLKTKVSLWKGSYRPLLTFWHRYNLEKYGDFGYVEVKPVGGDWQKLFFVTGFSGVNWEKVEIDLSEYANTEITLRFRMVTNGSVTYDGWYIDDVSIADNAATAAYPFFDDGESGADNWITSTWGLTNDDYHSQMHSWNEAPDGGSVSGVSSRLSQRGTLDFSGAVNPQLSFWYHRNQGYWEGLYVDVSANDGLTWTTVWSQAARYAPTTWSRTQIDLSDYTGLDAVTLRFRMDGASFSDIWYLDDIKIAEALIEPVVDEGILDRPASISGTIDVPTEPIYGLVYEPGITDQPGQGAGIAAQLGFGPDGSHPETWPEANWVEASYNEDVGDHDEYVATITPIESGVFDYAFRFKMEGSPSWIYADLDGDDTGGGGENDYSIPGALRAFAPGCEGDFDGDGDVDGSDLAVFTDAFGSSDEVADLDGDGYVDESDLAAFAAEFGRTDCPICP